MLETVWQGMYIGIQSFTSGGVAADTVTYPGRVMNAAFSLFLLIVIASFTANTATFLIVKGQDAGVTLAKA